jgi:hypothetical protein
MRMLLSTAIDTSPLTAARDEPSRRCWEASAAAAHSASGAVQSLPSSASRCERRAAEAASEISGFG